MPQTTAEKNFFPTKAAKKTQKFREKVVRKPTVLKFQESQKNINEVTNSKNLTKAGGAE